MKRASLSALPARTQPEPADLTDRLLAREAGRAPEPAAQAASPKQPAQRRKRAAKAKAPATAEAAALEADVEPTLDQALAQATAATEALRQAAQGAPARYELAVRYRLQALAHHLHQVTEFVSGRIPPP